MAKELIINNTVIRTPLYSILQDIQSEITNGKLKEIKEKGDEIVVTCPFHKDGREDRPSCFIYNGETTEDKQYSIFHCFTCGEKGPFFHFVAGCFDKSDEWAKKWLVEKYGEEKTFTPTIELESIVLPNTKYLFKKGELIKKNSLELKVEPSLNKYQSWHPYMDKRKLSKRVCEEFQVKYDPDSKCIIFPVWDDRNNLVMLTRRSTVTKAFFIEENKQKPVYLLNYIKNKQIDEVTVCESQINCLYMWSLGYPAVALFGTGSAHQYELLNRSGIKHYYLCFDGDQAGDNGIKRFIKNIRKDVFISIMILPRGKDANDLTKEELDNLEVIDQVEFIKRYGS